MIALLFVMGWTSGVAAQIPDVAERGNPKAIGVYRQMMSTYRGLKTFKCRVVDRTHGNTVATLSYVRPDRVFIQVRDSEGKKIRSEIRCRGGEVIVSSPADPGRHLRTTFKPDAPWITPLSDAAQRASLNLDDLAVLIDGASPPTEGKFVRTLRLLDPVTVQGVPADVLVEDQASSVHRADRWVTTDRRITYLIGKLDHLVRRITEEFLSNRGFRTTALVDFLDVRADPPAGQVSG